MSKRVHSFESDFTVTLGRALFGGGEDVSLAYLSFVHPLPGALRALRSKNQVERTLQHSQVSGTPSPSRGALLAFQFIPERGSLADPSRTKTICPVWCASSS